MFQVVLIFVGTDDFYWEMLVFNLIFGWLNVLFAHSIYRLSLASSRIFLEKVFLSPC